MEHLTVSIDDSTGEAQFLVSELSSFLLESDSIVRRASHVEPVSIALRVAFYALRALFGEYSRVGDWTRIWPCYWRVNLSPVNGPIIPVDFASRDSAIAFEIDWLEHNFL